MFFKLLCFYVSNFKKNFGYAHKREVEHCLVSRTIEKLNYFFRNISVKKKKFIRMLFLIIIFLENLVIIL